MLINKSYIQTNHMLGPCTASHGNQQTHGGSKEKNGKGQGTGFSKTPASMCVCSVHVWEEGRVSMNSPLKQDAFFQRTNFEDG